jgi:hypothetical protein
MTQVLPSNEHILLKMLTTASVISFLTKVYDFCTANQVAFRLTSKVTAECREQILSRNEGFVDEVSFNTLSNAQLLRCLQRTVQPKSRDEFVLVITSSVRFHMRGSDPISVRTFQGFYDALSSYKRQWLLYFDFMSYENAANVPHCNSKDNGLISLFIKPIPGDYAKNRYNTLINKKYNDIKHFIADMWSQVQMDYERFKQYQTLTTVVGDVVPGFDYKSAPPSPAKSNDKKPPPSPQKNPFEPRRPPGSGSNHQRFNNVPGHKDLEEKQSEADSDKQQYEESASQAADNKNDRAPAHRSDPDKEHDERNDYDQGDYSSEDPPPDQLNALDKPYKKGDLRNLPHDRGKPADRPRPGQQSKPDLKKDRNGCWNILRDGVCDNPNCKFSHEAEDLKKSWANLDQMLRQNERKFGASTGRKPGGDPAKSSD